MDFAKNHFTSDARAFLENMEMDMAMRQQLANIDSNYTHHGGMAWRDVREKLAVLLAQQRIAVIRRPIPEEKLFAFMSKHFKVPIDMLAGAAAP